MQSYKLYYNLYDRIKTIILVCLIFSVFSYSYYYIKYNERIKYFIKKMCFTQIKTVISHTIYRALLVLERKS